MPGFLSTSEIYERYLPGFKAPYQLTGSTPGFFISGRYCIINHLALGLSFGIQGLNGANSPYSYYNYGTYNYYGTYTYHQTVITAAFELTAIYITRRYFQFYGVFGVGVTNASVSYSNPPEVNPYLPAHYGNGQIMPLCFRFGDAVAGLVELGIGYKGIANFGIAVKLGRRLRDNDIEPLPPRQSFSPFHSPRPPRPPHWKKYDQ